MKKWLWILMGCCLLPLWVQAKHHKAGETHNWPHWRGPNANGLVEGSNPPLKWSETENIRWKVKLPGLLGHATPIIWGDKIFVQTVVKTDKPSGGLVLTAVATEPGSVVIARPPKYFLQFKVLALDRKTGNTVWEKLVLEKPVLKDVPEDIDKIASYASTSGITDGEHLYAFFGSLGIYCFDFDGNLKWKHDQRIEVTSCSSNGRDDEWNRFGGGSSPAISGNTLIIKGKHLKKHLGGSAIVSFIVAMDKRTGEEIWRKDSVESETWTTPFIVDHNGATQVIVATDTTRSYDLKTGDILWKCGGLGSKIFASWASNVIPMPVYANGVVYVTSVHSKGGQDIWTMQAISLDKAKGDITGTDAVLWSLSDSPDNTPYVSSPLLYGDKIYALKRSNAILSCLNAGTGEAFYGPRRLAGMRRVYASLVGANDRVYISDVDGTTLVVKTGPKFEVLATNKLDEGTGASPVIVGNELYLRGSEHLYCIAKN